MLFVGVDVSKDRLDCAVITDDTGKLLGQRSFLNVSEGIGRLLSWVRRLSGAGDASIHVVVDATARYHELVANGVVAAGVAVSVSALPMRYMLVPCYSLRSRSVLIIML